MLATMFIIAKKALVVLAGHILVLHAGDTVDARQLPKGRAAIEVQVGGSLQALGTAQRPVVLLGGKGTLISTKGQLYLQHCKLVGPQPKLPTFAALTGTGIQINGPATISNCTIRNYKTAIMLRSASATPPTITGNKFLQNQTAISINTNSSTPTNLNLSCNVFEPGLSVDPGYDPDGNGPLPLIPYGRILSGPAYGIKVETGSTLGNVGLYETISGLPSYTFAANVWPANQRSGFARGQDIENMPGTDWRSPTGWTSIASTGSTKYYKFLNEFIGTISGVSNILPVSTVDPYLYVKTNQQPLTAAQQAYSNLFATRCDRIPGDPFVAPTSVNGGGNAAARLDLDIDSTYLLQNIPNPAKTTTIIGYNIGHDFKEAFIEIVEAVTGRQKQYFSLKRDSAKALTISLKSYPQGLYTYRLVVDGKQAAIKKMIVQP